LRKSHPSQTGNVGMTISYQLERKQVIVIIGSVLLAISSYFIPLSDRTIPGPSQVEQAQEPLLPASATEQQPLSDPAPGQALFVGSQAVSTPSAEGTSSLAAPLPPSQSNPVNQPPASNRPPPARPPVQANQALPGGEPLSTRDFYTTSPDFKGLQILPITQDTHF
jgi:hypothetical protein